MNARLLLVIFVLALAGCATGPATSSSSSGSSHRVRCLYDPSERATRPLVFLLCIENP